KPAPVQRRHLPHSKKSKTSQQCRAEIENAEATQIDHEAEDAGETPSFQPTEPGGINLDHARSPIGLQVTINSPNRHKEHQEPEKYFCMEQVEMCHPLTIWMRGVA